MERQNRLAMAMSSGSETLTAELLAAHAREVQQLEERLSLERDRQEAQVKDKLVSKRLRRQERQRQQQDVELRREQQEQKRELADLVRAQTQEAEKRVIVNALQTASVTETPESVIRRVLEQRHCREAFDLETQFNEERRVAMDEAVTRTREAHDHLVEAHAEEHDRELARLMEQVGALDAAGMEVRRTGIVARHAESLEELTAALTAKEAAARADVNAALDVQYAHARLHLREQQYQEYAEALRDFVPDDASAAEQSGRAAAAAKGLERKRVALEEVRLSQQAGMEREKTEFEQQQQVLMEEDLAALEAQLELTRERDKTEAQQARDKLERRKQQLIEDRKQRLQDGLEKAAHVSEEQRLALLARHQEDLRKVENAMDAERIRQQGALSEKLQRRQEKQRRNRVREMTSEMEAEVEELTASQTETTRELQRTEVALLEETIRVTDSAVIGTLGEKAGTSSSLDSNEGIIMHDVGTTDEPGNMFGLEELLARLTAIETTLGGSAGSDASQRAESSAAMLPSCYMDQRDAGWGLSGSAPVLVQPAEITPQRYVVYRWAQFVVDLLATKAGFPRIAVLLAESLPEVSAELQNDYRGNAFRRSVFVDRRAQALFVRVERMDNAGELTVVLAHTLAHLHVGDMSDDTTPAFMRAFQTALRMCCMDMFASRVQGPTSVTGSSLAETTRPPFAQPPPSQLLSSEAFARAKNEEERALLVNSVLRLSVDPNVGTHS